MKSPEEGNPAMTICAIGRIESVCGRGVGMDGNCERTYILRRCALVDAVCLILRFRGGGVCALLEYFRCMVAIHISYFPDFLPACLLARVFSSSNVGRMTLGIYSRGINSIQTINKSYLPSMSSSNSPICRFWQLMM